jgi:cytochrome c biogenesis protein CcmG/thiol:disulfide interchange protein DsbE
VAVGSERAVGLDPEVPAVRGTKKGARTSPADRPGEKRRPDAIFRVIALVATLGLIAFIVVVLTSRTAQPPRTFPETPPPSLAIGTEAPDFLLSSLSGGTAVHLSALRGTPVVLNFFASWCSNCQAELSAFAAFARGEGGQVHVVGIDTNDSDRSGALRLLKKAEAGYPVGVDPIAKVATRYLIEALPVTYFIDSEGRVAGVAFGQLTNAGLHSWLKKLVTGGQK